MRWWIDRATGGFHLELTEGEPYNALRTLFPHLEELPNFNQDDFVAAFVEFLELDHHEQNGITNPDRQDMLQMLDRWHKLILDLQDRVRGLPVRQP